MIGYIIAYIIVGMIAGIIDDGSKEKKNNAFGLMIIGVLISLASSGPFLIAAIIEMTIGYAIIVKIKSFFKSSDKIKLVSEHKESKKDTSTNSSKEFITKVDTMKKITSQNRVKVVADLTEKNNNVTTQHTLNNKEVLTKWKVELLKWANTFNLKEIIDNIDNIDIIEELNLSNKKIGYIPKEIVNLKKLKRLICNNNNLKSLPVEIIMLDNLVELKLWKNQLKFLPEQIGTMKSLSILTLSSNSLSSLPSSIVNLKQLKKLYLRLKRQLIFY